ncbi:autotransporter-associated beta strand repeat-containing protein [Variovorax sp. MHTC-1]|uniref:autotransporter-associated beta strand repeat-containing protein n=1 Tax=Variovorax sp. MHTC-1 TaxID=2495593 RepID=UPI000F89AC39|nr:autotransporter-associated beta strand repeat-containing protein [Variovorax sp. MHTC-1]RST51865.1 autotransporter outer membrane beta-barrel domain-containing protein [Variovorax sp. MHTC-1]
MNHVFHTIWSNALGTWVAASELAKRHGKSGGADKRPRTAAAVERFPAAMHGPWALRLVALAALLALYPSAQAADRYWDANSNATGMGGAGTWDLATRTWDDGTVQDGVAGPYLSGWNNAALDTAVFMGTAGTLSLAAPIVVGGLTFNVGGYTISGNTLTLGGATPTITTTSGTSTISSVVAGSAGLIKTGAGELDLTGANTFTGTVAVNQGTLYVANDAALGAAGNGITAASGTVLSAGAALSSRVVTLTGTGQTTVYNGVLSSRLTGTGGVTSNASPTNTLNDYTGRTIISTSGSISFGSVANLGQASAFGAPTDATLGTIDLRVGQGSGSNQYSKSISYTGAAATSNRNWSITPGIYSGAQVTFVNNGSGILNLTGNFVLTAVGGASSGNAVSFSAGTADMLLSGVISSGSARTVGFSASAGRTLTLGNANTFGGTASISGGGMVKAGTLANSGTASSLGAGSNISIGGNLSYTGGAASIDRTIAGAGGTFRNDGTGAFTLAGATTLSNGLWLGGDHTASDNTLSGAVSGAGYLGSSGPATWVVTGNNTGFTGTLNVAGGTLRAGSATAFGSTIGGITVSGGTLDLNGYSQTTASLSGTGGTLALGAGNLTVDGATNSSFGGSIAGAGGLTKLGIGTLTLTGANTYVGATTIGGGTLALDFSNASAPASNIISSASTLNLQGGTLRVTGAAGEANAQAFNGLNVLSSNNTLNVAPGTGGSMQVDLGAVTYSGGLLNFASAGTFGSTGSARITTTQADGTLGGWATINGTDYAKVVGGYIVPFTSSDYVYKDNAANWVNGEILSDGGDTGTTTTAYYGTVSGTKQIGGLQYVATQDSTVNIGSGNTLGVDGTIVVSSSVGAATQTITGGSLTGVTGGGTLGIAKSGSGAFTVASTIVDNGGATGFAKSGTGTVVLSGANTYTGATTVSQGTLSVSSIGNGGAASSIGASSADSSNLLLQGAALRYTGTGDSTDRGFTLATNGSVIDNTVEVTNAGANLRFDGQVVSPDGANLIAKGPGTLTLGNTANTYSGTTTIDGGTLAVTELGNGGTASSIGTSSSASSSLVMKNGGTLAYLGGTTSSDRGFTLDTSGGIDVTNGAATLSMSGAVAGTLAGGTGGAFTKTGAGTLVLSGTNTYSGGTTVSAGTLRAGSARAFGSGPIAVNSGATLDIADIANVRAGGLSGDGTLNLGVLSSTRYLIDGSSSVFGGIIDGAGGVTLATGTQTFSGCQHTYAGPTTISGTLNISCLPNGGVASDVGMSGAAPTNLVLSGGTLNYQGGTTTTTDRGFTLAAGSTISVQNSATTLTFAGQATGGGGLVKSGAGTLVLGGTTNNYTGGTTVSAGILRAGATNAFGTATTAGGMIVANAAGAILDMNGFDTTVSALSGGGSTGGEIRLTDKTLTIRTGGGVNAWDFAGLISGTGNLVKNGASNQYLSGCGSTYTGTTTINAGVLSVDCLANGNTASAIGASDGTAGNLVLNGGTLAYTGAGASTDRQFTLGGSAALDASGTGAIAFTSTAPITLTGTAARTLTLTGTHAGSNSLSALIADSGTGATSLSKTGTGTWILRNPDSTYTGATTISGGGVLGVDKLADGGLASSIGASGSAASNLVIGTGSTLRYTGAGDSSNRQFTLLSGSTFIESSGTGPINLSNTGTVTLAGATAGASGLGLAHVVNLGGTNTDTNIFGATLTDAGTGKTTLSKNGTGLWVLTGNSTFTGDSIINQGNLMVGNGGTSGNVGAGNVYVTNSDSTLSVNRSDTFTLAGTLIGAGTLAQVGAGTTILTSTGSNIGNTTVSAGTLQVNGALTTATVAINGTSALTVNGMVQASGPAPTALTGDAGASTITVNTGGTLRASGDLGAGTDTLTLAGTLNTGPGTLNLGTGNDTLVLSDGGTITGVANAGTGGESGAGDTMRVNNTASRTLDGASTAGFETLMKQGTGTLTLTGTQSYSAGTTVQAGTLLVNGNQTGAGGPTTVQSGATLGGTGTVAGDVSVASGAALSPGATGAVGALTVNGNLTLNDGAALNYQFGQANVPGGPLNDLTTVLGDLTLDGMLNVNPTSGGSFTPGVYRVINYAGALTNNGLTIGSAPAGTYAVQTSVANQVNLVNSTGVTLNFWDGPGNQNDGTIQGGNGLWQNAAGGDNWTDQTANINATYADGAFAIFGGTAGTVTVDNSLGAVRASGMQFTVNGYTIDGAPLTLTGAPSIIRVGDGTGAGAGMTATIDAALVGAGGLQKSDLGTLVLNGANTYTGGTTVLGGTLQVASDANLGDASGGLTLDGGALRNTAGFASARTVTLGTNGGRLDTQADLALSGTIGGAGSLTKTGGGTLTLAGSNTYAGGTFINGGTVAVSGDANLGHASGALSLDGGTLQSTAALTSARAVTLNAGGGTFQTTGDLTLTGAVGGSGALTKTDAATLVLAANNTYAGGTTISAGTLQLGDGGTTGSIVGNVANNGTLAFDRSNTYSFGGTISGSGGVTQQGTGITVLTGNNSYAGSTAVNAGTLIVNGNQAAAAGATSVAAGATLGGAGTIGGDVSVADGATLSPGNLGSVPGTLTVNGNLVLGNASTLSYNFGQANVIGGAYNDLTKVAGDLTLGGTLNVTTTPGATFDPGIYRVISYGGTLTNNGLVAGTMPSPSFYVQTSVNNQVNLVNAAGLPVNFWDGPGNQNDGVIQGGAGVWQNATGNGNWTVGDGGVNAPFQDASFAVFAAAPGTVTVDNSLGAVRNGGMQFAVDGYTIQGDPITLAGAPNILRVGDGTADGAAMTATIASALTGTGGVQKTDLGTLVLTGANTYGGGTTITAGTLQLGDGGTGGSIIGDVANGSALVFNRSDSTTFSGAISGSGSVTQAGAGTTVLTGTNAYLGTTTVQAGILLVNGDQSGATGLTTVQGGATLGGTGTVGGDVAIASGATLSPGGTSAAGTLTVNGSLSLDSGSTLNYRFGQAGTVGGALNDLTVVHGNLALAGTLNVSAAPGGSFGPGVYRIFSYDGALTDNGLALGTVPAGDLFVQTSIAQQVNLVNTTGLTLNFWDGANAQGNGVVNGGDGTWRLADNDRWTEASGAVNAPYSNGAFTVMAGTPGTVTIDNGNGQVEASGLQFAVDGYRVTGGTLALVGSTPTLRVGDGTAAGADMTATIDAALAGTGALTKTDLGTLVLNGSNTYTGTTTVEAGTLAVNGVLGGSTNVLAAGRLKGSGTIGSTTVAGTIAPGNSIGTLTVSGNYTQAPGSTYEVEVDPGSNASDLIHATGTASIGSGARLNVVRIHSGAYTMGNRYRVLTADGGLTGTYSLAGDTSTAFVQLVDSYDANNVYLNAEKVRSFTEVAGTPNQVAVATALDSLPQSNGLANAVAFLPSDFAARDALNQLSVDIHASNKTALLEDSRFVREAAIERLRTAACAPGSAPQQPAQPPQEGSERDGCTPADNQARTAWGQVFGSWGHIDGNGNAAKLERDIGGFVVGADTGVGGGWRVGALGGYSRASADTEARNSSAKTDSYHLGAYGGTQWGATALRLGANHSWHKTETSRSVAFAGFADTLSADYDSTTTQLFGEAGHRIDAGRVALEPFARLAHVRVKSDAFLERGGLAALYGEGGSVDATFTTLGLRASTQIGSATRLRGMLGWRHAFGDTTPTSTHAFAGSIPFTLEGVPLAKNVAVLEAGVETQLRPNLMLGASYSGQFGNGLKDHGFKVNLNWAF